MRIGITGHINLTHRTVGLVEVAIRRHLEALGDGELIGVSSLAPGADSLFAQAALAQGGTLEVILPSEDYRQTVIGPKGAEAFDALVAAASSVRVMPHERASRTAYADANTALLDAVDELVAVWDGVPGQELGSTAEVVAQARSRHIPVTVVWPKGASRASGVAAAEPT